MTIIREKRHRINRGKRAKTKGCKKASGRASTGGKKTQGDRRNKRDNASSKKTRRDKRTRGDKKNEGGSARSRRTGGAQGRVELAPVAEDPGGGRNKEASASGNFVFVLVQLLVNFCSGCCLL